METNDSRAIDAEHAAATEYWRPRFHFTPARNWMNDPNGLSFIDGTWHLYYQYNPLGIEPANMSWGHAVSLDLLHWEELPVALMYEGEVGIFSGSAVLDSEDDAGFGGALVAAYTIAAPGHQSQGLAFSLDEGLSWEKYEGNPVLDRGSTDFRDPKVFRYLDSSGDGWWVMVAVEAPEEAVVIYRSTNLKDWELTQYFQMPHQEGLLWECPDLVRLPVVATRLGKQRSDDELAETRDLDAGSPADTPTSGTRTGATTEGLAREFVWALILSTNPGGAAGGSGMRYLLGDFDGAEFTPFADSSWKPLDWGPDYYAAVSFSGLPGVEEPDGRVVTLGWMSNWDYAEQVPTRPWRGAMSLPRELAVVESPVGFHLIQHPAREVDAWFGKEIEVAMQPGNSEATASHGATSDPDTATPSSTANSGDSASHSSPDSNRATSDSNTATSDSKPDAGLDCRSANGNAVTFDPGTSYLLTLSLKLDGAGTSGRFVLSLAGRSATVSYNVKAERLTVDRSGSESLHSGGSASSVADHFSAQLPPVDGTITLSIFVDSASIEVFSDEGTVTLSAQMLPRPASGAGGTTASVSTAGEIAIETLTWRPCVA
ncbi:MAG: glycoside hydrolase family 32 protein [Scrofimicrobium sp.]